MHSNKDSWGIIGGLHGRVCAGQRRGFSSGGPLSLSLLSSETKAERERPRLAADAFDSKSAKIIYKAGARQSPPAETIPLQGSRRRRRSSRESCRCRPQRSEGGRGGPRPRLLSIARQAPTDLPNTAAHHAHKRADAASAGGPVQCKEIPPRPWPPSQNSPPSLPRPSRSS